MKNQSSDILKVDDLCPDGIRVVVAWDSMVVGASIFVQIKDFDPIQAEVNEEPEQ